MAIRFALLFAALSALSPLCAQQQQFPDWVQAELNYNPDAAPEDAGVWRLLDQTTVELLRDGSFKKTRRMVQVVLKEGSADGASIYRIDGNEDGTKIKKLKGWHLNSAGKMKKLDKKNVITVGASTGYRLVRDTTTLAHFRRVGKGSVIAFESQEIRKSFFSVELVMPAASYPIRKRIVSLIDNKRLEQDPVLVASNMESWGIQYQITGLDTQQARFSATDIPAIEGKMLSRNSPEYYPRLMVGFMDSNRKAEPLASWDNLAQWYLKRFTEKSDAIPSGTPITADEAKELHQFFRDNISYKQRYLSLARGWVPARGDLVAKRGYGDCKDMVSCLAWRSSKKGHAVLPAMANIMDGFYLTEQDTPAPWFNHLIAAIPLESSLGFPAEVEVKGQLYLLMDPTDRYTRLGYLPAGYEDRHIMICTPQGAAWTAIPDSAIESEQVTVKLMGNLKQDQTMIGTLTVIAEGDAYGLRTQHLNGSPQDVEYSLRNRVGIPGVAELKHKYTALDDNDILRLTYQIKWPGFMRRDAYGYRLPRYMVSGSKRRMEAENRVVPIYMGTDVDETWHIDLNTVVAFDPGVESFQLKNDVFDFTWTAAGGKNLNVLFTRRYNPGFYAGERIEAGRQAWADYRNQYNTFYRTGTLFTQQGSSTGSN